MNAIKIGNKTISETSPVFIIAEVGVNHNGDLNIAKKLVDAAADIGADCVKFQTYKTENLVTKKSPKAEYQLQVTDKNESQFEMLKRLELKLEDYVEIISYCKKKNIIFLSTPYNIEDIDFLQKLGVPAYKIASGQIVETPFIEYLAKQERPIIASTGMAYLADVDKAVRTMRENRMNDFILLQCVTNYPASSTDSNVRAMITMQEAFKCHVGYSDHTQNNLSIVTAVALGAKVVEKHFTLDKNMPGPDHSSSADVEEFRLLIKEVREVEKLLGNGIKVPASVEKRNAVGMRRSLVVIKEINKGDKLSADNLGFKRPEGGLLPDFYQEVIGKSVNQYIVADTPLTIDLINWK